MSMKTNLQKLKKDKKKQRDRPVMALWRGTDAACYAA